MNKILILLAYINSAFNMYSQPVDKQVFINEAAYVQPFLHLVNDEKYFAKYAIEAHNGFFDLMEPIKCKLHVPTGINKVWQDAEKKNPLKNGDYDYSNDFSVGLLFNFYVGGVLVSSANKILTKPTKDKSSFTYYFELNPLDFSKGSSDINFAYIEFLKNIKKKGSQLVIEAALTSKTADQNSFVPIASGSFYLQYDEKKYEEWLTIATD